MPKPRILIVDDEPRILRALVRLLRKEGYLVLTAESGEAGLEALQGREASVVISDYRMPGMSGVDFLRQVKAVAPDAVRVIISGYMDVNLITEAVNAGEVFRFITKPWDDGALKALVWQCVEQFQLVQENQRLQSQVQATNRELRELNRVLEDKVAERTSELLIHNKALRLKQEVLDNLPTAVVGIDAEGTVVLTNDAACERLIEDDGSGTRRRPVIGAHYRDCLPLDLAAPIAGVLSSAVGSHAGSLSVGDRRHDVHVVSLSSMSHTGGPASRGIILVAHDVAELDTPSAPTAGHADTMKAAATSTVALALALQALLRY